MTYRAEHRLTLDPSPLRRSRLADRHNWPVAVVLGPERCRDLAHVPRHVFVGRRDYRPAGVVDRPHAYRRPCVGGLHLDANIDIAQQVAGYLTHNCIPSHDTPTGVVALRRSIAFWPDV